MRAILGFLLFGIFAIAINLAGFVVLLISGANSGLGFKKHISHLLETFPGAFYTVVGLELATLILWPLIFCILVFKHDRQLIGLIKQMVVGWIVMLGFISIIATLILLALYHDGRLGELATFVMGLLTTPFTMEIILGCMGVILVIILNTIRLKLSGDEYVEVEIEDEE